ncbi:MAG: hypothetical protein ACQEW0_16245 [Pseudomonadota bacterium]
MLIPVHVGVQGTAEATTDELFDLLICRNEDLEHEKMALLSENDALVAENVDLRKELAEQARQLATMRAA